HRTCLLPDSCTLPTASRGQLPPKPASRSLGSVIQPPRVGGECSERCSALARFASRGGGSCRPPSVSLPSPRRCSSSAAGTKNESTLKSKPTNDTTRYQRPHDNVQYGRRHHPRR